MQWIFFLALSLILIAVSRKSLLSPRSHGFHRFFAWESILGLIVLNAPTWFRDPFAWYQMVSWPLLTASLIPLALGIHSLRTMGRPDKDGRPDPRLLGMERTTHLVSKGIYRFIRHPLYSSLLLLNWGAFFKRPSLTGTFLAVAATLFLVATAKADERECVEVFGAEYSEYMKHTKMFLPFAF